MEILDFSVDYSVKQKELDEYVLKVDRENVKALIDGFNKDVKTIRTSIIVAGKKSASLSQGKFKEKPKLIKSKIGKRSFKLSKIGEELNISHDYRIENKYIAMLDSVFYIKNNMKIWEVLCKDNTFDIWDPYSPYQCLKAVKGGHLTDDDKEDPSILLFRIFEIDQIIPDEKMKNSDRSSKLKEKFIVTLKRPILEDEEFLTLKRHLVQTIDEIENSGKISKDAFDKVQELNQKGAKNLSIDEL